MNINLVMFAIKSAARLRQTADDTVAQWESNVDILVPALKGPDDSVETAVTNFFSAVSNRGLVNYENAPYAQYWDIEAELPAETPGAIEQLHAGMLQTLASRGEVQADHRAAAGAVMVKQWQRDQPSPWLELVSTAADIAVDYLQVDPDLLAEYGDTAQLLQGYVEALAPLLDQLQESDVRSDMDKRLGAVFLKAGLDTVGDHAEQVIEHRYWRELLHGTAQSMSDAIGDGGELHQQLQWKYLIDNVVQPTAKTALAALVDNPAAVLGSKFAPDAAVGILTQALFAELSEEGVGSVVDKDTWQSLYKTALGLAVQHPELFVGDEQDGANARARQLLRSLAKSLDNHGSFWSPQFRLSVTDMAFQAVAKAAPSWLPSDGNDWQVLGSELAQQLLDDMAVKNAAGELLLAGLFTTEQLLELGRNILERLALSPAMVLGKEQHEWRIVFQTLVQSMLADEKLLLSSDDWLQIAKVAASEAAANPARLFGFDDSNILAAELIKTLLTSANQALGIPARQARVVLYGETLKQAIFVLLKASAGRSKIALEKLPDIQIMTAALTEFVADNYGEYGSKEWLRLYRLLLSMILSGQQSPPIEPVQMKQLLSGNAV